MDSGNDGAGSEIMTKGKTTTNSGGKRQRNHRRFRGLTCANCRMRKVKCEGSQPTCKTCEVYHVKCHYDKPPPLSQVVAMAKKLQEAEKTIERLQEANGPLPAREDSFICEVEQSMSPASLSADESRRIDITPMAKVSGSGPSQSSLAILSPTQQDFSQIPKSPSHPPPKITAKGQLATDISIDENGKICYYGPTSAVHEPLVLEGPSTKSPSCSGLSQRDELRSYLTSHARESAIWEDFALGNTALQTGISRQVMARLLHLHWTWVAPMFMWVYRPAFVRDMTTGGRYYSEFLLMVLCAHSSKYQDSHYTDLLFTRVRALLGDAIQQPSSIPTVQGLLQLSARELAQGSISQAWLYSGMAFRMAEDLGLQHNGPNIADLKGLTPIDLEIRRRLFWSCYFWDKAMSLYTGRLPAVTELPQNPIDFMDDSAEFETWSPYFEDSSPLTKLPPGNYPSMKSYAVSCFANSCKLSVIINEIIVQLYSRRSRAITETSLQNIKDSLHAWRAESPAHLRYDPDYLPTICPPPHIISQKYVPLALHQSPCTLTGSYEMGICLFSSVSILYYTTVILAHRPFWSASIYYQVCINAAHSMERLLLLLESTFGFDNITYLMGYCIYTGASAILEDAKSNQSTAHSTIKTFLRALNGGMRKCPLLERSLNIIIKGLKRAPLQRSIPDQFGVSEHNTNLAASSYIPAFPYFDPTTPNDFDMDAYLNNLNMDTMATLDCYPELQLDLDKIS